MKLSNEKQCISLSLRLGFDDFFPCNIGYNVNINPALTDQLGIRTNLKAQMSKREIYIYFFFIYFKLSDIHFI